MTFKLTFAAAAVTVVAFLGAPVARATDPPSKTDQDKELAEAIAKLDPATTEDAADAGRARHARDPFQPPPDPGTAPTASGAGAEPSPSPASPSSESLTLDSIRARYSEIRALAGSILASTQTPPQSDPPAHSRQRTESSKRASPARGGATSNTGPCTLPALVSTAEPER